MDTIKTRAYYFTTAELHAIKVFCQLADSIAISENIDYDNNNYFAEDLFHRKYQEYVDSGECSPSFVVSN